MGKLLGKIFKAKVDAYIDICIAKKMDYKKIDDEVSMKMMNWNFPDYDDYFVKTEGLDTLEYASAQIKLKLGMITKDEYDKIEHKPYVDKRTPLEKAKDSIRRGVAVYTKQGYSVDVDFLKSHLKNYDELKEIFAQEGEDIDKYAMDSLNEYIERQKTAKADN